jgi:hypothetical protein
MCRLSSSCFHGYELKRHREIRAMVRKMGLLGARGAFGKGFIAFPLPCLARSAHLACLVETTSGFAAGCLHGSDVGGDPSVSFTKARIDTTRVSIFGEWEGQCEAERVSRSLGRNKWISCGQLAAGQRPPMTNCPPIFSEPIHKGRAHRTVLSGSWKQVIIYS